MMDGLEVVKAVKHMRPDIDVVIITGFATVETAVECMKYGAMDYVQKPFTEDELLAFVKKSLIRRQDRIQKLLKPMCTSRTCPRPTACARGVLDPRRRDDRPRALLGEHVAGRR